MPQHSGVCCLTVCSDDDVTTSKVNAGGYSEAVYGDDEESFYQGGGDGASSRDGAAALLSSPVPVFVSSSGGVHATEARSPQQSSRPLPALPESLYDERTLQASTTNVAALTSAPTKSRRKEDIYASPNRDSFTVELRRPDLRTSYGFSLGENGAGAKFITGVCICYAFSTARVEIVALNRPPLIHLEGGT